jgi:structural maintenance of chromosome 4
MSLAHPAPFDLLTPPLASDDDDDDEPEEDSTETSANAQEIEATPLNPDALVKAETDQPVPSKRLCERTPSYELHIYSVEELCKFKKREMIADSELLDGTILYCLFLNVH